MSYQPPVARSTCTLAVVSLAFGIAAWIALPLIGALAAVVCGHLARGDIRHAPPGSLDGDGMASTGLILGYVQLLLALLVGGLLWGILFLNLVSGWHWH